MERSTIIRYTNTFRKIISQYLKNSIGIKIEIYNCGNEGAVLNIKLQSNQLSGDVEKGNYNNILYVLNLLDQRHITGDLSNVSFKGTNTMMERDRVIIIKDCSNSEWSEFAAKKDVMKLVNA
ncbi:hypothetical protein ASG01_08775 [Chryseobacterium sp. Leaf180]|uniref:hypothetical protein n=1 Tax=Chryseobacterium sp. Leaf180 TaxID=1736289 RepID=UPI0006FB5684|nr:hypothetical protein [Chryseobacterium sp. Leaf180]KQR93281.1 hypothetical protein ASG01_08775 [Chryseobacterium sp. Leaf180]